MTKYPWGIDMPLEEINANSWPIDHEFYKYLLDRLKIAEAERDSLREWTAPFKKGWE